MKTPKNHDDAPEIFAVGYAQCVLDLALPLPLPSGLLRELLVFSPRVDLPLSSARLCELLVVSLLVN